jgi:hypothetical protein
MMNALPPEPSALVSRVTPFSGNVSITVPIEHVGAAVGGGAAATGAGLVAVAGGFGSVLVGVRSAFASVAVGSGVTVAGSGVTVTGIWITHGVCVAARVGGGVIVGFEPHALKATATVPSTTIHFGLVIFTTFP